MNAWPGPLIYREAKTGQVFVWCRYCKAYNKAEDSKCNGEPKVDPKSGNKRWDYCCKKHHAERVKKYKKRKKRESW